LTSVETAVRHLRGDARVTDDLQEIRDAEKLIFPGVGAAGASMENLHDLGITEEIQSAFAKGKPILGICIGCQVVLSESEEDGGTSCLGLIPGKVTRFNFAAGVEFYFVHSYYPVPDSDEHVQAHATYGGVKFSAALARDNLVTVQFHAEKSGRHGLKILENFLNWKPN
jgi:glutamine amidotransferase